MTNVAPNERISHNPNQLSEALESLVHENLRRTTGFARSVKRPVQSEFFGYLWLLGKDGVPTMELPTSCDDDNRAMLDKVYRLSRANMDDATVEVRDFPITHGSHQITHIPCPHDFEFIEHYSKGVNPDGKQWEMFTADYSPVKPELPEVAPLTE